MLSTGICFLIEAREEASREAGAVPARELQDLRFEPPRWISHTQRVSRGPVTVWMRFLATIEARAEAAPRLRFDFRHERCQDRRDKPGYPRCDRAPWCDGV